MRNLSRRTFVRQAGMFVAVGELLWSGEKLVHANPLGLPIGCQTWSVRSMIANDFPGTLKQLAAAGFQSIEMCSPVGYADSGFGGLRKYSGKELRSIIQDAGLICVSSHFSLDELRKDQDGRIAWAKDMGMTQMLVASLGGPKKPTMDEVKFAAGEYNKIGERAAAACIVQGLHNEDFECTSVDGQRTYDLLFKLLDPSSCSSSSRCRQSARDLTPPNTSRSIRGGSSPCTCKDGQRRHGRLWRWGKALSTGSRSFPRPKQVASRTTSSRWTCR